MATILGIGPSEVRATSGANCRYYLIVRCNVGRHMCSEIRVNSKIVIVIPTKTNCPGTHPPPALSYFWGVKGRNFNLLVRAECVRCPWLLAETKVATIGPSEVRVTSGAT